MTHYVRSKVENYMKTVDWFTIPELCSDLRLNRENGRKYVDYYFHRGYLYRNVPKTQKDAYSYKWSYDNRILLAGHTFHEDVKEPVVLRVIDSLAHAWLTGETVSKNEIEWLQMEISDAVSRAEERLEILKAIRDNPDIWDQKKLIKRWVFSSPAVKKRILEM